MFLVAKSSPTISLYDPLSHGTPLETDCYEGFRNTQLIAHLSDYAMLARLLWYQQTADSIHCNVLIMDRGKGEPDHRIDRSLAGA